MPDLSAQSVESRAPSYSPHLEWQAPAHLQPPARQDPIDWLILAGEHSGDQHAAQLVRGILQAKPNAHIVAIGGPALAQSGASLILDMMPYAVIGFWEVIRHWGFFRTLFSKILSWITTYQPRQICTVDYPGLNLRLAQALRDRGLSRKGGGQIGVHHYISPQIWAWKRGRRFKMSRILDSLGVIFPFEAAAYADTTLPVYFVGHPFVQTTAPHPLYNDPIWVDLIQSFLDPR